MPSDQSRFQQAYRINLLPAQRREVLRALRESLDPETTLGEIVDAAESLGWGEPFGDMSLAELASALVDDAPEPSSEPARATRPEAAAPQHFGRRDDDQEELDEGHEDEDADEDEDEDEPAPAPRPVPKKVSKRVAKKMPAPTPPATSKKKAASKPAAAKKVSKKAAKKSAAKPAAKPAKKVSKKAAKKPAKKKSRR